MDAWCGNCQPNQPIDNIRNASQLYGTELFISTNGFILTDIFPSHLRWYVLRAWYDHCDKLLLILTLFLCINQANITKIDVLASLAFTMAWERESAINAYTYNGMKSLSSNKLTRINCSRWLNKNAMAHLRNWIHAKEISDPNFIRSLFRKQWNALGFNSPKRGELCNFRPKCQFTAKIYPSPSLDAER